MRIRNVSSPESVSTTKVVIEDYLWLEKLPKRLRAALVEARYNYPCEDVYNAYQRNLINMFGDTARACEAIERGLRRRDDEVKIIATEEYLEMMKEPIRIERKIQSPEVFRLRPGEEAFSLY